jgi:hypothetical protein
MNGLSGIPVSLQLRDATGKSTPVLHCFPVYGGGLQVHGVGGVLQVRVLL